jgi:DNA ligase-1
LADGEAPPVLLAHVWESDTDLTGWWMSEKLDGVRAYWDGKRFISRLGNQYHAPDWFTAGLPDQPLDGELWVGRKKFQSCVSIVKKITPHDGWREVRYLVFDAPAVAGPFEDRLEYIKKFMSKAKPTYAAFHPHEVCRGTSHMREELARVEGLGGEGLMMRRPRSSYEVGRSYTLLKVKTFHDAEAKVNGHQPGTGKHKGRLGALLCEMPDGTQFAVGTGLSDAERNSPPPIGSIITYRYQELSDGGVPRFPSYVGVRHDFRWPGSAPTKPAAAPPAAGPPTPDAGAAKAKPKAKAKAKS